MYSLLKYLKDNAHPGSGEHNFIAIRVMSNLTKIGSYLERSFYTHSTIDISSIAGYLDAALANALILASSFDYSSMPNIEFTIKNVSHKTNKLNGNVLNQMIAYSIATCSHTITLLTAMDVRDTPGITSAINDLIEAINNLFDTFNLNIDKVYEELANNKEYHFLTTALELKNRTIKIATTPRPFNPDNIINPKYKLDIEFHPDLSYKRLMLIHKSIPVKMYGSGELIVDFFHASAFLKDSKLIYYYTATLYDYILNLKDLENAIIVDGVLRRVDSLSSADTNILKDKFSETAFHVLVNNEIDTMDDLLEYVV